MIYGLYFVLWKKITQTTQTTCTAALHCISTKKCVSKNSCNNFISKDIKFKFAIHEDGSFYSINEVSSSEEQTYFEKKFADASMPISSAYHKKRYTNEFGSGETIRGEKEKAINAFALQTPRLKAWSKGDMRKTCFITKALKI